MSDIPVGSPPVPPGRHAAPGGWYPDPVDPAQERYWDGWQWSRTTRARETGQPTLQRPYGSEPQNPYAAPYPGAPAGPGQLPPGYPAVGTAGPHPVASTADGVPLAGWWWRVLATLIDQLITSVVIAVLGFPLYRSVVQAMSSYLSAAFAAARAGVAPPPQPTTAELFAGGHQALLLLLILGVGMAYQLVFLRRWSATPGKLICGLRVVPVDRGRSSSPLAWGCVLPRAAIWVLPGVTNLLLLFQLVDVLVPLFQPRRQALHDLAARTQVVRGR